MKITITIAGTDHEVEDRPIDHVAYSTTARRHKWPTDPQADPIIFGYFVAYSAAKRVGIVPTDTGWDEFLTMAESIDLGDEDDAVDPTATASSDA